MDIKTMSAEELEARSAAIVEELDQDGADVSALGTEIRAIRSELKSRKAAEAAKAEIRAQVAAGAGETIETITEERETKMTDKEIRSSKEYIDAYVDYIKGKNDGSECRSLLTENVEGTIPVPAYVEGRIQTAWQNDEIMSRVRKTFVKGNLKVGVEISADPAAVHVEGGEAPQAENLVIAMVNIIPATVKKWLLVSSEVMDLTGQEFLDYLYDEIVYQIVKQASVLAMSTVTNAPAANPSITDEPQVADLTINALSLGDIVTAIGMLQGDARNICFIANRGTIAAYQALALAANYPGDIWGGATVIPYDNFAAYNNIPAGNNLAYAVVGDLGAITANYPAGDDVKFVLDQYSYAESDMVKLVGRQMVGCGLTRNMAFTRLKKA